MPAALIAHDPAERRELARLLVLTGDGSTTRDQTFADFPSLLRAGDVLVLNETRVIPARLQGTLAGGGSAEALLLRPRDRVAFDYGAREWFALVRPGKRLRAGARIRFGNVQAEVIEVLEDGPRVLRFDADTDLEALLREAGEIPLPPYVAGPRRRAADERARTERYQTVFARVPGSVAAPTASLHFTTDILGEIEACGVEIVRLVLNVGSATFRPMSGTRLDQHVMHAERFSVPAQTAEAIERARAQGRRIVAAGTTVIRALESIAQHDGRVRPGSGETALFIVPGFRFRVVDALLTNFHLPRSTLLALVSAFAGYDAVRGAYADAIARHYRFFSFGDAMFCERAAAALGSNDPA